MGSSQSRIRRAIVPPNPGAAAFWGILCVFTAAVICINCYSIASVNGAVSNSADIQTQINDATLAISLVGIVILFSVCVYLANKNANPHEAVLG